MTGDHIANALEGLIAIHCASKFVGMDNGTEITYAPIIHWCEFCLADIANIDLGAPWQNAFVESPNGILRDELLAAEIFTTLLEDKDYGRGLQAISR